MLCAIDRSMGSRTFRLATKETDTREKMCDAPPPAHMWHHHVLLRNPSKNDHRVAGWYAT
jgi:hypothetical protein